MLSMRKAVQRGGRHRYHYQFGKAPAVPAASPLIYTPALPERPGFWRDCLAAPKDAVDTVVDLGASHLCDRLDCVTAVDPA
jgi:hypothetical protein